jgi:CHAT domain-containing protein/Tfp pilus assembly protein PilF
VAIAVFIAWVGPAGRVSAAALDELPAAPPIRDALERGDYAGAEREARGLFASLGGLEGARQPDAMAAGDLLLDALIENGRGAESDVQQLARELARRQEAASPRDPRALAHAMGDLGAVLFQAGDYRQAVTALSRARTIRQDARVASDGAAAADLTRLAFALIQAGRYDDALSAANDAVAIAGTAPAGRVRAQARALDMRGLVWQRRGDYARARADLDRALALQTDLPERHPDRAMTLTLLGVQSQFEGDSLHARESLERAVSIADAALRPDHPDIAWFLRWLAVPVQDLGDLPRARALQERAAALAERSVGLEHPLTADCLQDLANTLLLQADYDAARSRYERALEIYQRRFGDDYPDSATVLYNLAILHAELGDFARARALHRRALALWERTLGREHAVVARSLWVFGQTLADQGLDREAVPLFEQALAIRRRTLGDEHVDVAETLSSLAVSLARLGESSRALALSTQAMRIWDQAASPDAAGFVRSLLAHGAVLSARGDTVAALAAYDRARNMQLAILGASHPEIAAIDVSRATLMAATDRRQEALQLALAAEDAGRRHLSLTLASLPERQALDYAAKRPQGLSVALTLVTADSATTVLDAVVRSRSLVTDEVALRRRAVSHEAGGQDAPQWTTLRQARERLANLIIRGPGSLRPGQYAAIVSEAEQAKEDAERRLAETSAAFRAQASRADVGLNDVRAHLAPGSALVSIVRFDRQAIAAGVASAARRRERTVPAYLAFVVRSDRDPIVVPLGEASRIDALVARWRQAMLAEATGTTVDGPSLSMSAASLRRRAWDPIAAQLGEAGRIFVVPDGAFNLVPLAALPSTPGRYLLEDGPAIHYLSAERELIADDSTPPSGTGLLSVGGAAFSDASSFATARTSPPQRAAGGRPTIGADAHLRDAAITCGGFRTMQFGALPASRREAETVAALWREFRPADTGNERTLTGPDATERAFKDIAPGHRVLHVATHGFFLGEDCAPAAASTRSVAGLTGGPSMPASPKTPQTSSQAAPRGMPENPLLLSGLALAGANRRSAAGPDEEDGILTAEEVAGLDLDGVEWAVLSACETGLGTIVGHEGVLGLRRAFQVAGVRSVIMSLWAVDDRATVAWMEALYDARFRQNASTVDAVRDASLRALRDRRARKLSSNPFFWAAFVASGSWR